MVSPFTARTGAAQLRADVTQGIRHDLVDPCLLSAADCRDNSMGRDIRPHLTSGAAHNPPSPANTGRITYLSPFPLPRGDSLDIHGLIFFIAS
jgi:hypothetical protein